MLCLWGENTHLIQACKINFDTSATIGSQTKVRAVGVSPPTTAGLAATTHTSATSASRRHHWSTRWPEFERLREQVYKQGAQSLPGNTVRADNLYPKLRRALAEGVITVVQYSRMMKLLRFGAELFEIAQKRIPAWWPSQADRSADSKSPEKTRKFNRPNGFFHL